MNQTCVEEPGFLLRQHMRSKLNLKPPSSFATPAGYSKLQKDPGARILDDNEDAFGAPIALLYDGFGRFEDIISGRADVTPGGGAGTRIDQDKLERRVDSLVCAMQARNISAATRQKTATVLLSRIFSTVEHASAVELRPVTDREKCANVTRCDGPHGAIVLGQKTEAEFRVDGQASVAEVVAYIARSNSGAMVRNPMLYQGWRVPALAVMLIGKYVQFFAVVHLDQYRVVPLTPALALSLAVDDLRGRKKLYDAFKAAALLRADIHHDVQVRMKLSLPKIPLAYRRFPNVTKVIAWPRTPHSGVVGFSFTNAHSLEWRRWMYRARTRAGEQLIVKFTRQYCTKLHDLCAEISHTPKLLGFQELPGNWFVVVMPYVPSEVICNAPGLPCHLARWKAEVRRVVEAFHEKKLVHSDLRDANILVERGGERRAMIIDFDWGGKDGWVSYPNCNLHQELTEGRTRDDLVVTKEDDLRILQRTFERLEGILKLQ